MQTKGKAGKETMKVCGALQNFRVKKDLQMRLNVKPHCKSSALIYKCGFMFSRICKSKRFDLQIRLYKQLHL